MFGVWILLLPLLLAPTGVKSFMIYNTQHRLCLEDNAASGEVLLKECNLDLEYQQWTWIDQSMLMCVASSRCLLAILKESLKTQSCRGLDPVGLMWDCNMDRLISRNTSMLLSTRGRRLTLSKGNKYSTWRTPDQGDICQEKLRSRRESDDPQQFEFVAEEEETGKQAAMTEDYNWYYRTEDSTMWTFVLLGLAFICLLIGFLLLGMGAMANKSRKEIAKYKAAAAAAAVTRKCEGEELLVISTYRDPQADKANQEEGIPAETVKRIE